MRQRSNAPDGSAIEGVRPLQCCPPSRRPEGCGVSEKGEALGATRRPHRRRVAGPGRWAAYGGGAERSSRRERISAQSRCSARRNRLTSAAPNSIEQAKVYVNAPKSTRSITHRACRTSSVPGHSPLHRSQRDGVLALHGRHHRTAELFWISTKTTRSSSTTIAPVEMAHEKLGGATSSGEFGSMMRRDLRAADRNGVRVGAMPGTLHRPPHARLLVQGAAEPLQVHHRCRRSAAAVRQPLITVSSMWIATIWPS